MVAKYGLEDTLLREFEWKKTNDPHIDVSPYSFEDDMARIKLMTVEGYVGAANAILTRPDLTERIGSITAPTLVMVGEWDDFLPCAERDANAHPRFAASSSASAAATAPAGASRRSFREIDVFLETVETGRRSPANTACSL